MIALGRRRSGDVPDDASPNEVPDTESLEFDPADAELLNVERVDGTPDSARGVNWTRVLVYGVLPGLALILGMTAGFLRWQGSSVRDSDLAAVESLQVAKDSTVALLSYRPETVERDLIAARDRTTGDFRDSYTQLTDDVVIPGSKEQQIATAATITAASSISADPNHAVALVFINQSVTTGKDKPTNSESSVRVTLDKVGDRWLVSAFDPV